MAFFILSRTLSVYKIAMYIPTYSIVSDKDLLKSFIQDHSFGTLIVSSESLSANHYPFLLTEENEGLVLWTHLAKGNPQWKTIADQKCLVIFTGPHAYISPEYYEEKLNVPTWNYTAVHAQCEGEVISDELLQKQLMEKLVQLHESKNGTSWDYNLPKKFHDELLNAIVWLKLKVISLEGKFKLSQNRDQRDYEKVVASLSEKHSENIRELLNYMTLTNPHPGQK